MTESRATQAEWTYADALRLEQLLPLAEPYFESPHHDELEFVIIHQCTELWFKLLLHELDAVGAHLSAERLGEAMRLLRRCRRIVELIDGGFDLMGSMTAHDFVAFRDRLMGRSGFQSAQFRELEISLGRYRSEGVRQSAFTAAENQRLAHRLAEPDLWQRFVDAMRRAGYEVVSRSVAARDPQLAERGREALREMYVGGRHPQLRELSEELVALDTALLVWRSRHALMAENVIGSKPGTGEQGVNYLYRQARVRFFPELIELRSSL
jgi:tryptophan 2,3-dioxygenase